MQHSNQQSNQNLAADRETQPQQPPQPSANQKSKTQTNIPTWLPIGILLVALIGIADAGYLAVEYLQGRVPPCSILQGCAAVTTSSYAEIFGIPVAVLGTLYYFSVAGLMIAWLDKKNTKLLKLVSLYSIAGLLASAWFVYVQLFILQAICIYCMGSVATSSLIFILGMMVLYALKGNSKSPHTS